MLVGVPSYRSAVALQRRDAIREMGFVGSSAEANARAELLPSCVSPACTWLRFVMAEDQADVDKEHGDVWFFKLPARRRAKKSYGLEKYLLSNAFLREAARRADSPPLVVLADDDTLFNATDLSLRMAPFAASPRLVFGNLEEWFMWDPVAMISTCYAYSSRRWELAQLAARNRSFSELSRREKECVHARAVGPFPYAKGHFLGYSLPTAKLLVSLFGGDEEYSLNGRTTNLIEHPFYNKLLKPTHPQHPTNKVLTEDVYYMHLLFKALRNDSLTLLHLTLSEYVVERGNRALRRADIYHKLKRPERFAFAKKGCGVELDIGGVCGMTLGDEQCQQISEAIAFLPSALRPPTQAEAQEMMDKKCDEIRQSGQIYLIKKAIIGFLKNPFKTIQSIIKSFS